MRVTPENKTNMQIDFTPSVKSIEKAEKIHQLRQLGVQWEEVAKTIGNTRRYCLALYRYWKDNIQTQQINSGTTVGKGGQA